MGTTFVISGLVAKRAELAGRMEDLERQKAKLRAELRHIDHSLAIFGYKDPPRDIKPIRPKDYRFRRRELWMLIREIESEAVSKPANREIALTIMERKGWDIHDRELVAKITDSVKSAKNWQNRKRRRFD